MPFPGFSVNQAYKCSEAKIEEMLDLLDLETLEWSSRCLRQDMTFANRLEEELIQELRVSETEELISLGGKRNLVRLLLTHFFNPPKRSRVESVGHEVVFPVFDRLKREEEIIGDGPITRSNEELWALLDHGTARGIHKTLWFSIFFEVSNTNRTVLEAGIGGEIFKRLNAIFQTSTGQTLTLAPKLSNLCFSVHFSGLLCWENIQVE
ncbi:hypothetical protein CPK_ORF00400 [Chlamydia pneumoniae LPCoLN]|nr:hypothetical protein CPK_ORF00400 [Chlamydia pneumoniae LPCoLN]